MEEQTGAFFDWGIYGTRDMLRTAGIDRDSDGGESEGHGLEERGQYRQKQGYEGDPTATGENDFTHEDERHLPGHISTSNLSPSNEGTGYENNAESIAWVRVMADIGVCKEAHELCRDDMIGRAFTSIDAAEVFFTLYARLSGFSVRKGHKRKRADGKVRMREWLCSREGQRSEKMMNRIDRVRKPKPLSRVECKVVFRITQPKPSSRWIVREFITTHSHNLVQGCHLQFLRSNKEVNGGAMGIAMAMRAAGIRNSKIMSFMAEQAEGYDNLPYARKDLSNKITADEKIELADGDAAKAIGYLQHKADNDVHFYGKYSFDEYGRLKNLVWADTRSQADYATFGHAIAFDTTYRTNAYKKPLLVLIGINQHYSTSVLAFAILIDETVETYRWVIEAFLDCMKGRMPETVITDGDLAMRSAVAELMPNTVHRLCTWHIKNNAISNIKDPGCLTRLRELTFRYYTPEEFDVKWTKMIEDFGLQENSWVKGMYSSRKMWAETFLRDYFFAGMTTTQRCEGMNSFLKTQVESHMKLSQFVRRIDIAVSLLRHKETSMDYISLHTSPVLGQTNMDDIEKQAAKIYSRQMFFMVRQEIKREGRYLLSNIQIRNGRKECTLYKYTKCTRKRHVVIDEDRDVYSCSCNSFPSRGIPCRHLFASMKALNINRIPDCLILKRWTVKAKDNSELANSLPNRSRNTHAEESGRFGHINLKCAQFAFYAARNDELCSMAAKVMDRVTGWIRHKWEEYGTERRQKTCSKGVEHNIKNPVPTTTKGAPRSKGIKGGALRKCSVCNKRGHNKATCSRKAKVKEEYDSYSDSHVSNDDETTVPVGENDEAFPDCEEADPIWNKNGTNLNCRGSGSQRKSGLVELTPQASVRPTFQVGSSSNIVRGVSFARDSVRSKTSWATPGNEMDM